MYKKFKATIYKGLVPFFKLYNYWGFRKYLATHSKINLIVGSAGIKFEGWFGTDIDTLNVTKENDFRKYFKEIKISKVLAEHVVEHLTTEGINNMLNNLYKYSMPDINIRIAVPDGFHADKSYIERVRPGGTGEGALDHKHLFTYKSLSQLAEGCGFKADLAEYWDEDGKFHTSYKNDDKGMIRRSFLNDERNADGNPNYTSLIIDLHK